MPIVIFVELAWGLQLHKIFHAIERCAIYVYYVYNFSVSKRFSFTFTKLYRITNYKVLNQKKKGVIQDEVGSM